MKKAKEMTEQEIKETGEQILMLRDKKPAHEVAVEMIREIIPLLDDQYEPKSKLENIAITIRLGILSALLELLKRMVIPKEHFEEVVGEIKAIKNTCPGREYAEQLFPEKFFMVLKMSQPWWGEKKVRELSEGKK